MMQQISSQEYKNKFQGKQSHILLDVRGKIEWDEGHIEGAVLLPHFLIPLKAVEMFPEKDIPIVVYCQSGGRSQKACESLINLGYSQIFNLAGGFEKYTV